jgi:hypothetical protein
MNQPKATAPNFQSSTLSRRKWRRMAIQGLSALVQQVRLLRRW